MQQNLAKYTSLFFLLIVSSFNSLVAQDYLPPKPQLQTSVYDYAHLMDGLQAKQLEQKLIKYSDSTSTQIVVITVKSLQGKEVSMYATELAHKWGIGQAGKDNGILVLVSKDDRRMTIRTGYGVEHKLTDALSRRIIETILKPHFRNGDYYVGLDMGTTRIFQIMNGEYQGEPESYTGGGEGFPLQLMIMIFFIIMMMLSRRNRGKGGKNGGRKSGGFSILDAIILSNMGRGTMSGGGFGGGSSGGFGGGGFGGGGGFWWRLRRTSYSSYKSRRLRWRWRQWRLVSPWLTII